MVSLWSNTMSVLFGYQSVLTTETVATQSSKFNADTGEWRISLNEEVSREKMTAHLIHWMSKKHFQAIVTGPRTICFFQSDSNRQCFCQFQQQLQEGKCVVLGMRADFQHQPGSPTDIFGQSIFTELTLDLARDNFLAPQIFNGFEPTPESPGELIARENLFSQPSQLRGTVFVRMHKHDMVVRCAVKDLAKFHFDVQKAKVTPEGIVVSHLTKNLVARLQVGYNRACELLLTLQFERLPGSVELPAEEAKKEKAGTAQQFASCMKLLTITLAQKNLLRSQKHDAKNPSSSAMDLTEREHFDLADCVIDDPAELRDDVLFE